MDITTALHQYWELTQALKSPYVDYLRNCLSDTENCQSLLENSSFIKLMALSNLIRHPLTSKDEINLDPRVLIKSIKYGPAYAINIESRLAQVMVHIKKTKPVDIKAHDCICLAKALKSAGHEQGLYFALKAYRIIKKNSTLTSALKLKVVKVLATFCAQKAYKATNFFKNSQRITALYYVYKNSYMPLAEKCHRKICKLIAKKIFLNSDEQSVLISLSKREYTSTVMALGKAVDHINTLEDPLEQFRLLAKLHNMCSDQGMLAQSGTIITEIQQLLDCYLTQMRIEYSMLCSILLGKKLRKRQPVIATKFYLLALELAAKLSTHMHKIFYICQIFKYDIGFTNLDLENGYKMILASILELDDPQDISTALAMLLIHPNFSKLKTTNT